MTEAESATPERRVSRRYANYVLAGAALEAATGESFEELAADELFGQILKCFDVRHDTLCLDRGSGRGVVTRGRQADCAIRTERNDGLN